MKKSIKVLTVPESFNFQTDHRANDRSLSKSRNTCDPCPSHYNDQMMTENNSAHKSNSTSSKTFHGRRRSHGLKKPEKIEVVRYFNEVQTEQATFISTTNLDSMTQPSYLQLLIQEYGLSEAFQDGGRPSIRERAPSPTIIKRAPEFT